MRTLDGALVAAQKKHSRAAAPKIVLSSGATEHTYSTERVTVIEQLEEQFRHRATVQLVNADNHLTDLDYKGYSAVLYDGLITKDGTKQYSTSPMKVISQQFESSEGRLVCVLNLVGIPDLLSDDRASDNYVPTDDDTKTIKDLIREVAGDTGVTHLSVFNHCQKYDVEFDSEDDLIGVYTPKSSFRVYTNGSRLAALKRLLDFTNCVMRFGSDGKIHVLQPTISGTTYDSEYSLAAGQHYFFSKAVRETLVIPNYITVQSLAEDDPQYSGTANSSASYALLPKKAWRQCKLASNEQAADIASAMQAKYELSAETGSAYVPINAGAELFDYVKVTDSRNGDTRTGNIGSLRKVWKSATEKLSSQYYMQFSFGGWFNTDALWKDLEINGGGIGDNSYLERLSVKNLYAENIQADNLDLVWIDPEGNIDLSQIGDNLDNLPDGEVYGRIKSTHIEAGEIKLTEYAVYQDGYNPSDKSRTFTSQPVPPYDVGDLWTQDGFVRRCTNAKTSEQSYSSGDWATIDQDDIPNGTSYRRVKSTSVTTDGIVILDQVKTGTYGLVLSTDITAGHIKLSSTSGTIDDVDDGTTYAKVKTTQISAGKIVLSGNNYVSEDSFEGGESRELIIDETGIAFDDGGQCFYKTSDGTEAGYIFGSKYGGSVVHLAMISNDRLYLYCGDLEILPGVSHKMWPGTSCDLGSTTYPFADIYYSGSLYDTSASPKLMSNALGKIKKINTHKVRKGNKDEDHFDPESLPEEMIKRPSESEIEASEKVYQEHLAQKKEAADKIKELQAKIATMEQGKKRDRLVERIKTFEQIANHEPSPPSTRPAVDQHSMTGMLISAIKELTERIETLEAAK